MTLAILCSGQGWQNPDMFALTGEAPEASELFACATKFLGGIDLRHYVRTKTNEAIHRNRAGQILCTTQALAVAAVLKEVMPERIIVAGYSVGEVAAWGVAGLFGMTDALELVARRSEAMDAASRPGDGLLFIRGLSRSDIDRLCERYDAAVAIVNPGDAYVLGGGCAALQATAREAALMNATKVIDLPVEVASHTKRLVRAAMEFRSSLRQVPARSSPYANVRVLSGIDGSPVTRIDVGLDKLAAQISQTVQWESCLHGCMEAGATAFLKLGPGRALSKMVQAAYPDVPTRSLDDFKNFKGHARG
ncbi:acyltransferase domain-containing protein [Bradyrhizobium sp. NAS96.2]|uniref:ACP S-malonyltransferase n=1 Tax=Bradyrhizobium sp. NAS96.2 TaxID=1680160 RepID=UPI00093AC02D|nr:acyltransferase domain-containing protein [Bradyrhizobium sp. NAS96.2]OKO75601.1 ACP S-malonyltransferase [Bradyrhizobium sp. NAS96.2]